MKQNLFCIIFAFFIGSSFSVWADDSPETMEGSIISKPINKTQVQLMQITKRKLLIQKELKKLEKKTPSKEVTDSIDDLQADLESLNQNYEALATQIPIAEIPNDQPVQKGWLVELEEITRPVLNSLRELTERPRKIDKLKAQIERLKNQVKFYEFARKNIMDLEDVKLDFPDIIDDDQKKLLSPYEIKRKFTEDLSKLKNHYNPEILMVQLDESERNLKILQDSDKNIYSIITESIAQFMSVRGRNLAVALGLLFGLWWLLTQLYKGVESKTRLLNKVKRSTRKIIKAGYHLVIFLIAFSVSLFSLYLVDDWLLLSLLFLVLVAMGWTSRQFVPKFLKELNLILNLGTVREGERIFYEGIPWLIKEIGFHVILHNPRLEGGIIRVPVGKLFGHSSRSFVKEEEWFPTQLGDWVLFEDNLFAQIVSQTPEQVILLNRNSRMVYLTTEFLTLKPRNLSTGYLIVVNFGLDYSIQNRICDEIPNLFQSYLEETFREKLESHPPVLQHLKVKFDHAGPSSLDLIIMVDVNGSHAEDYFSLKRNINKTLVSCCNAEGFTIPFNQLTINLPPSINNLDKKD